MKKVNSGASSLLMSLIEIMIGILLLIDPVGFTSGIIVTLGIVLTIMGLNQVVQYFRSDRCKSFLIYRFPLDIYRSFADH